MRQMPMNLSKAGGQAVAEIRGKRLCNVREVNRVCVLWRFAQGLPKSR
jgi:hypothetical protein